MSMPITDFQMPQQTAAGKKSMENYSVKTMKVDIDDPVMCMELDKIQTEGIQGDRIVILDKDKFTFMDKYFIVVTYMEKN